MKEEKKIHIAQKYYTIQLFTVRILVYLFKSPFSPAKGDVIFPESQIQEPGTTIK